MSTYRELLIGCGRDWSKKIRIPGTSKEWTFLTALDYNDDHKPHIVYDLRNTPYNFSDDNMFDEIHAYEVLEHIGTQGDYLTFFAQFSELWRITKPYGYLCATVPAWDSIWAWGDPSHTRIINSGSLVFLDQDEYTKQVGITPMSDFRHCYKASWKTLHQETKNGSFSFVLQAIK